MPTPCVPATSSSSPAPRRTGPTGPWSRETSTQARATFDNLALVASSAGASLDETVRVGVYLRDLGDFAGMNELFSEYFGEGQVARTTLQADLPGFAIEVDGVLCSPSTSEG